MTYQYLSLTSGQRGRIALVTLRRPEVHNAFNAQLIQELNDAFTRLRQDEHLHGVILTGEGKSFSAGADLNTMREVGQMTQEQNVEDALKLADLLRAINTCPCPVIARVNGTAMGGGLGLIAVCDIAIAVDSARFAFSEVKLGIAPAVISPYVVAKIGISQARALFVTGERFSAERAKNLGLIHGITSSAKLDEMVQRAVDELLSSGPQALRACKKLALTISDMEQDQARNYTAELIADLRSTPEAQEGLSAFLEKRRPQWTN
jgi:methylglutaconyl-CoA hydratase